MTPNDLHALLKDLRARLDDARRFLLTSTRRDELAALGEQASRPELWDDPKRATEVNRKLARYEQIIAKVQATASTLDDGEVLLELAAEEDDPAAVAEVSEEALAIERELSQLELESLYFGPYDDHPPSSACTPGQAGSTLRTGRR